MLALALASPLALPSPQANVLRKQESYEQQAQQQKQQEQAAPPKWKQMETEGHHCPLGKRNARKEECKDAVEATTSDIVAWKVVDDGEDSWVPHGCSYNIHVKTALWNDGVGGNKVGTYRLICTDKTQEELDAEEADANKLPASRLRKDSADGIPLWRQMASAGHTCPEGERNPRQDECLDAVKQASDNDVSADKTTKETHVREGEDSWIPAGCSYNTKVKTAVYNTHPTGGTKIGTYKLICRPIQHGDHRGDKVEKLETTNQQQQQQQSGGQ